MPVVAGGALLQCAPAANPCRQAHLDFVSWQPAGAPPGWRRPLYPNRNAWDPVVTLAAVRGPASVNATLAPSHSAYACG